VLKDRPLEKSLLNLPPSQRTYVGRRFFNETSGVSYCEQLNVSKSPDLTLSSEHPKYLALAACAALFKYLEQSRGILFHPNCLRIRYSAFQGTLFLDVGTIEALELLRSSNEFAGEKARKEQCLLGVLDKTKTLPGRRFLRKTLLEPPSDINTINTRQELVAEIIESEELYFTICELLSGLPDLESVVSQLIQVRIPCTMVILKCVAHGFLARAFTEIFQDGER